jgi:PAS domain S-box-containing protein
MERDELQEALEEVIDAAILVTTAERGTIQLLDPAAGVLRIVAHRGFAKPFLDLLNEVPMGQGAWSAALERGERVIVEDLEVNPSFSGTPALAVQRAAGVRAVQSTPLLDSSGRILGVFSTHYGRPCRPVDTALRLLDIFARQAANIVERVRAEEALRESEAQARSRAAELEALMDAFPAVVFISHDPECRTILANRTGSEILHTSPGDNVSQSAPPGEGPSRFRVLVEGREVPSESLPMHKAASSGAPVRDCEWDVGYPDGSRRTLLGNAIPLFDDEGRPCGAVSAFFDITERKRAEEALRESEGRLRTVIENSRDGINLLDLATGRYAFMSPAQMELTGFSAEELDGLSAEEAYERIHPADRDVSIAQQRRIVGGDDSVPTVQYRWMVKDGTYRWFSDSRRLVRDAEGRPVSLVGVSRDITAQKEAEEDLRRARDMLTRLNETLEQQVAERTTVAENRARQLQSLVLQLTETEERERRRIADLLHDDLQQLLSAARFQLSALRPSVEGIPSALSILEQVDRSIDHSIQKSRSLSHELSPAILHLTGLPATLEWMARRMRESHGLTVEVEARDWPPIPDELVQVFLYRAVQEMLFNVVKHAGTDRAWVRLEGRGDRAEVTVSDRGKGFDPGRLDRVGDDGKAVGLAGVRHRIDLMGGSLEIDSAPGRGSVCRLSVPVRLEHAPVGLPAAPRPSPPAAIHAQGGKPVRYRVLLADDHPVIRQGLTALLDSQADISVVAEASNGREAAELTRTCAPDVVLMDVAMPEMDGIEATRLIKSEFPRVRVIGLSMLNDADIEQQMRQAGAEAHLSKAGAADALVQAIRRECPK